MDQKAKDEKNEEHVILLDLHNGSLEIEKLQDIPRAWPMGQFCSLRTGTFSEMDSLRRALISNNLKTLMRNA
ncbi:hypothetical protein [uncultured Draconibacterium sp.]|uniref:hypothetical protein n=1 Tax=uncultured Draconibacterium sp. TaxID=1573823 RepID=UPI0025EE2C7F|nr:hypothetical protein [uncultured Draconibacterium sp.]